MLLQFEYFYGSEAEDFTFYRIPKKIITSPHFKDVSYGAKMLYGLLFDRVGLSIMNSWFDEENRAYIIFSIQEIMDSMYCSNRTHNQTIPRRLDQHNEIGFQHFYPTKKRNFFPN